MDKLTPKATIQNALFTGVWNLTMLEIAAGNCAGKSLITGTWQEITARNKQNKSRTQTQ